MFERFTDRARRVLVIAQQEARTLGHEFLGGEHILLALLSEGEGIAAKALRQQGLVAAELRQRVNEAPAPATEPETAVHAPPFTPDAKRSLEAALREALNLGHEHIGTEHLLLGLLRDPQGPAARVLVESGLHLDDVHAAVLQLLTRPARTGRAVPPPEGDRYEIALGLGMSLRVEDPDLARDLRLLSATPGPVPLGVAVRQTIQDRLDRLHRGDQAPPEPAPDD